MFFNFLKHLKENFNASKTSRRYASKWFEKIVAISFSLAWYCIYTIVWELIAESYKKKILFEKCFKYKNILLPKENNVRNGPKSPTNATGQTLENIKTFNSFADAFARTTHFGKSIYCVLKVYESTINPIKSFCAIIIILFSCWSFSL